MRETFRLSMAYMHTWLGLVLGFVLMVVFFFGTLSVFDREIDRWSVPETRAAAAAMPSFDRMILPYVGQVRPDPESMEYAQAYEVIGQLPPADRLALSDVSAVTGHRDPLIKVYGTFDVPNKPRDSSVDHVHVYGDHRRGARRGSPYRAGANGASQVGGRNGAISQDLTAAAPLQPGNRPM